MAMVIDISVYMSMGTSWENVEETLGISWENVDRCWMMLGKLRNFRNLDLILIEAQT